jgi:hypothetical protein
VADAPLDAFGQNKPQAQSAVNAAVANAQSMLGKNEVPNHAELQSYLQDGGQDLDPHKLAWCAAFVSASLTKAGLPVPTQVVKGSAFGPGAYAPNYLSYGSAVDPKNVQAGDILVNNNGSHVGFAEGPTRTGPNGLEAKMIAGNDRDPSGQYAPGSYTSPTGAVANRAQVGMVGETWAPLSQYSARRYQPTDGQDASPAAASSSAPAAASPGGPQQAASGGQASYLPRLMQNIAGIESSGWSNPYAALGPVTKSGDRAYGKYQVMGTNVPSWTQEVLGQSMTPQQFAANPDAQEKVAGAKLGQYAAQYGPAGAANMWFTGKPNPNPNITDATATSRGTSAGNYAARAIAGIDNPNAAPTAVASAAPPTAYASAAAPPGTTINSTPAAVGALGTPGGPALPGMGQAQSNQFLQGASGLDKAMGGQGLQGQQGDGGQDPMKPSPMIGQAPAPHIPNAQAAAQTFGTTLNSVRTPLQWGSGTPGSSISATAGPQVAAGVPQGQTAQDLQQLQQQMQQQRLYQMMSGGMGTSLASSPYGGGYG